MIQNEDLNQNNSYVNLNIELEREMLWKKLQEKTAQAVEDYNKVMKFMSGDAPIQILCLDKKTEKILLVNGYERIYDLFDVDFTEIKGLGPVRRWNLTTCLHEFLSMI